MVTVADLEAALLQEGIQARCGRDVGTPQATPLSEVLWLELKPSPSPKSTQTSSPQPSSAPRSTTATGTPATASASVGASTTSKTEGWLAKLAELSSLQVLCLTGLSMTELSGFPVLPELKRFEAKGCAKLEHLPACIGELTNLEYLVLTGASSLQGLPPEVCCLPSLRVLCIEGAGKLTQLPGQLGALTKLELVMVQGTSVRQLPDTLVHLERLELLDLYGSRHLQRLPESLGGLCCLKVLDLQDCVLLTTLPDSLGDLSSLQALHLTGCKNITALPGSLGRLNLTLLDLRGCQNLSDVPLSIGNLKTGLQSLWITEAPSSEAPADVCTKLNTLVQRSQQRHAIALMATQQAPMLLSLERMSWLVVLLATATFIAFLQPPGGYDQYEVLVSNFTGCPPGSSIAGSREFQQCSMLLFFTFDALSFGLSLGCVMMIVVMSMPRLPSDDERYEAGRFWLLLLLTWVLLWLSVVSGFAAFAASGLAVHKQVKMVLVPLVPGMVLLCVGLLSIFWRFHSLHPGRACVLRALHLR